jgi:hypothetical protein
VRYANRYFQLERQSPLPPARSTVQVFEDAAGAIEIRYRDRRMRWTEIPAPAPKAAVVAPRVPRPATPPAGSPRPGPCADHLWHHGVARHREYQQLAKDRRGWERVQP